MVIRFKTGIILVSLSILALIPGCSKQTKREYITKALPALTVHNAAHTVSKDHVTFYSRVIPKEEGSELFDGRGKKLYKGKKNAYLPIQLSIENNSAQSFKLKKSNISLKLAPDKRVINRFAGNNVWKILGVFFGGLAVTAMITGGPMAAILCYPFTSFGTAITVFVNTGIAMATLAGAGIIGTTAGTAHYVVNKDKQKVPVISDYYTKALPQELEIQPYQKINKLMFVKARELKPFTITLEDQSSMAKNVTAQINLESDYAQQ